MMVGSLSRGKSGVLYYHTSLMEASQRSAKCLSVHPKYNHKSFQRKQDELMDLILTGSWILLLCVINPHINPESLCRIGA